MARSDMFFLAVCLMFIATMFVAYAVAMVYSWKLFSYLRKFMPDTYDRLTIGMLWGLRGLGPVAGLRFIFNRTDTDNSIVNRYRELIKGGLLGSLVSFIALLVTILMRVIWELHK